MNRRLMVSAEARREIREAAAWYEGRSPGLGRELLSDARECFRRIEGNPATGSKVQSGLEAEGARRVLLKRFPFSIVYIELEAQVRVLAFAHVRRRPGYWKSR